MVVKFGNKPETNMYYVSDAVKLKKKAMRIINFRLSDKYTSTKPLFNVYYLLMKFSIYKTVF